MKTIKINLQQGVSNIVVTDINKIVSYPVVDSITLQKVIADIKVLHPNAAYLTYVPQDMEANLIKHILIVHPEISGNELIYPVALGEAAPVNNYVESLTNLINSI